MDWEEWIVKYQVIWIVLAAVLGAGLGLRKGVNDYFKKMKIG